MNRSNTLFLSLCALILSSATLFAQTADQPGCKDNPLFNRMPSFHLASCHQSQFDQKNFPVGPPKEEGGEAKGETVEGAFSYLKYEAEEGTTIPSPLQIMRNFENAAKKAGGTVVAEFPGWCKASVNDSLSLGNPCILYGATLKFVSQGGKETYAFVQANGKGEAYEIQIVQREAMKQDIVASDLRDQLNKNGFIALYINFETASAAIKPDSTSQLDEVAGMLKSDGALKLEVGGHTDNTGTPDGNMKLSDARAASVVSYITQQGVAANRMTAKGYGQTAPIADNRTEEGRAKNRRVELVKK